MLISFFKRFLNLSAPRTTHMKLRIQSTSYPPPRFCAQGVLNGSAGLFRHRASARKAWLRILMSSGLRCWFLWNLSFRGSQVVMLELGMGALQPSKIECQKSKYIFFVLESAVYPKYDKHGISHMDAPKKPPEYKKNMDFYRWTRRKPPGSRNM